MYRIKMLCLAIAAVLISYAAQAQINDELPRASNVTLTKSDPYQVIDGIKYYFSDNEGGILAIKILGRSGNLFNFQKFSGDRLNLLKTKSEIIEIVGFNLEFFKEINGKLYMFYSVYDKLSQNEQLFVRSINFESGGFNKDDKLLVKTNRKLAASYFSGYTAQGKFSLDLSSDESTFIIKYRYPPENRDDSKNNDILGVSVFSHELEELWKDDLKMPYTESLMDNLDFTIGSNGSAYFLVRLYKEEKTRENAKDPNNESLAILTATPDGEVNEAEFRLKDEYVLDDVILAENAKQDIICAGYYRKRGSYGADGSFIVIMDKNGNLEEGKYYEFSIDFIKMYKRLSERGKKKMEEKEEEGELAMSNLYMRSVRLLDDGSVVLAGEIFYITTHTDSKGNTRTVYHYDDVILVKINPDGELGWVQKFPKRSTSESFKLMASANYTYVLFSDNPNNSILAIDQNPMAGGGAARQVIAWRVGNNSGEREYLPLFGYREIEGTPVYQYSLGRVVGLSENSFAVEMYIKQKKDMMFKITLNE